MTDHRPQPAATVIDIFGGISETAAIIKRDRSIVNKWLRPKEKGGTDGAIPPKHWPALVRARPDAITFEMLERPQEAA